MNKTTNELNLRSNRINTNVGHYGTTTNGTLKASKPMNHRFSHGMQGVTENHDHRGTTKQTNIKW